MGLMSSRDYDNYSSLFALMESFVSPPTLLLYLKSTIPHLVNKIQKEEETTKKVLESII